MKLTCKEASRLLCEGLDRDLSIAQRLALRLHLAVCEACRRINAQFEFLRRALAAYPGPEGEEDRPGKN